MLQACDAGYGHGVYRENAREAITLRGVAEVLGLSWDEAYALRRAWKLPAHFTINPTAAASSCGRRTTSLLGSSGVTSTMLINLSYQRGSAVPPTRRATHSNV